MGHYAFEAVEWAAAAGVTTGYTDGTFKPQRPLVKRHAVVFMERYCDEILGTEESPDFTRGDMMVLLKAINDGTIESGTGVSSDGSATSATSAVLALLDELTVAAEHTSGYDRNLFKHWIDDDGDGCDTRREVLLAEAVVAPTQGRRCSLSHGEWISRYDGLTEQGNGSGFDVDHLVPLAEAWESGAHRWSADRRERYANDLGYEHSLVAVSARSNRSKGAQDPAMWLPPEAGQHCWYAAAWVHVKTRWSLSVDTSEADTLEGILSGCSDSAIDVGVPGPGSAGARRHQSTARLRDSRHHNHRSASRGLPPRLHTVPAEPSRRCTQLRRPHSRPETGDRQGARRGPLPPRPRRRWPRLYKLNRPSRTCPPASTQSGRSFCPRGLRRETVATVLLLPVLGGL